jgi:hypothetical protein
MERIPSRHDYLRKLDRHQHWKTLEDARRHLNEDRAKAPTGGRLALPIGRPIWSHLEVTSPSRGGLQLT